MTEELKKQTTWRKFTVEVDHSGVGQLVMPHFRRHFRAKFSVPKLYADGGAPSIGSLASMPDVRGTHIELSPNGVCRIYDPHYGDEQFWKRVAEVYESRQAAFRDAVPVEFQGFEEVVERPTADVFKGYVYEVRKAVDADCMTVVEGTCPSYEQIDAMPGRLLNDPLFNSQTKPKYKDQVDDWKERLAKVGAL